DHNFGGGDGIATAGFGLCTEAKGMTIDSQGRIVVVGVREHCLSAATSVIAIARFRPDGTPDPTFGAGSGKKVISLAGTGEEGTGVALNGDKIVVAGDVVPKNQGSTVFMFLRLNDDGTLDHSFSNDGIAFVRFGSSNSFAYAFAIAVQSNHEVVACGDEQTGGSLDFAVARLSPSGSLDTSFSSDGKVTVSFSSRPDVCQGMAIDAGKIVLAGFDGDAGTDVALARLTSDGHLDTSFGT